MKFLEKISRRVNQWTEYLVFGLGLGMALVVAVQVLSRYLLNHSLFWSEELARFLLVWLTFLGASVAYYRKAHPGIDVIYARMPARVQRMFALLTHLACVLLFGVMMGYGIQFAHFVRHQITPALNLPKWTVLGIIPVSGTILMIHGLYFLLMEWRKDPRGL